MICKKKKIVVGEDGNIEFFEELLIVSFTVCTHIVLLLNGSW